MADHIANRELILQELREELVGPSPRGEPIDCSLQLSFSSPAQAHVPRRQSPSGEEILTRDSPTKRYGVGVLYPMGTPLEIETAGAEPQEPMTEEETEDGTPPIDVRDAASGRDLSAAEAPEDESVVAGTSADTAAGDDLDISAANTYRPSSMAMSFLAEFPDDSELIVEASGGRYQTKQVLVEGEQRTWWLRRPVVVRAAADYGDIWVNGPTRPALTLLCDENLDGMSVAVEAYSRPYDAGTGRRRLVTVCLVNRSLGPGSIDELALFQCRLSARVISPGGSAHILPYPRIHSDSGDQEEESLELLYREMETYAVGHGCSADWTLSPGAGTATEVRAESLPTFDTPDITPDVTRDDGTLVEVPMDALAGLTAGDDGHGAMTEVVELYEKWVGRKAQDIRTLGDRLKAAAERHLGQCRQCAARMRSGLEYLRRDRLAYRAFQLANRALLLQQASSAAKLRAARYDRKDERVHFSSPHASPDSSPIPPDRGMWRAFQIAFLLMAVKSTVEPADADRQTVELVWFPTGGGKTEAYLGLAAFAMFFRRLKERADAGTTVLMRYTLRLLTAQQFLRASGLICAMERIRRELSGELGAEEYSIGMWLGGATTPNTREQAREALRQLRRGGGNRFILDRCPWCAAQLGWVESERRGRRRAGGQVLGYEALDGTVVAKCPDDACLFHHGLPVYVIDEDIYDRRPSLVIGTVDKFAMLAWRPEARPLFGIRGDGVRMCSPPSLIIQDELHLISGPLGSMVGLYEAAIEELCTDYGDGGRHRSPKIVCSTATIRRYAEQVRALYGRGKSALFPPPGLSADDSFFAKYARFADGSLRTGRVYVGVHAPGLGSMQTAQVRTLTSLLQAPVRLPREERDPWWTLVVFFNSLRELGTTLSLLQSDIPDRTKAVRMRMGLGFSEVRPVLRVLELTGRISSDKVPKAISDLETECDSPGRTPVDVCLASSIMEVGIDINRLSIMAVVGQPKLTSQYIQVTGRVGRDWQVKPGLVVTIYSASKPRDRSHFEKFRSYHERLYAQVEPTSVTPFSPPALDRALHAVMVAYVRHQGSADVAARPYPVPTVLLEHLRKVLISRVRRIAPDELPNFERVFSHRLSEWQRWERTKWSGPMQGGDVPLLREAGAYVSPELAAISWPTPISMRNVDAECQAEITTLYLRSEAEDAEGAD